MKTFLKVLATSFAVGSVLLAPVASIAGNDSAPTTQQVITGDIVGTAVANGNFKTLASLLEQAGMVGTLKGDGPFTVFAPTDAAFAKLPATTLKSLQDPKNKSKLQEILGYHVLNGAVYSSDIKGKLIEAGTLTKDKVLKIDAKDKTVKVNDATVVTPDVRASNGVIHVIDTVLIPSEK